MPKPKVTEIVQTKPHDHICDRCETIYACVAHKCDPKQGRMDCPSCLRAEVMRLKGGLAYFLHGKHTFCGSLGGANPSEMAHMTAYHGLPVPLTEYDEKFQPYLRNIYDGFLYSKKRKTIRDETYDPDDCVRPVPNGRRGEPPCRVR